MRISEVKASGKTFGSKLPALYEKLNAAAIRYQRGSIPNHDVLVEDLEGMLRLLTELISHKPDLLNELLGESFIRQAELEEYIQLLQKEKNLILQGPPGTGKTWLAKRLAYVLVGGKDTDRIDAVQFHPNISYEDFIRGFRPNEEGRLDIVDGPFMQAVVRAREEPNQPHVLIIEEVNRGDPAQIFGEMLTLLEPDKRNSESALRLTYQNPESDVEGKVFIPPNLYIIGTMNLADRSLAMVDYALRRRFSFITLEPEFGDRWRDFVKEQCGLNKSLIDHIQEYVGAINREVTGDDDLGVQFQIGHSFFTPAPGEFVGDTEGADAWFARTKKYQVEPLMQEYWFDDRTQYDSVISKLPQY